MAFSPAHRATARLDGLFRWLLFAALAIGIITMAVIIVYVVVTGWPRLDASLILNMPSLRFPEQAGAQSAITGTIWVIAFSALFSIPVGVMTAIYLEELARSRSRFQRIVEVNIQNLAAVPSIVYGILGLALFGRALALGQSVATAALTLALLILPIVIIASREALRAVPQSFREASFALGATPWQTILRQTLPAAAPGIATGVILALSRAIGEAAPLLLVGAAAFVTFNPDGLLSGYTTLPIQIFTWIKDPRAAFQVVAAAAIVLLLILLVAMNLTAILIRKRTARRW